MNANIAVWRAGPGFSIQIATSDRQNRIQEINYNLRRFRGIGRRHHESWLSELLELAAALYAADRVIDRPRNWAREFRVDFPVSHQRRARWEAAKSTLEGLLRKSTGDHVELRFSDLVAQAGRGVPVPLDLEFQSQVRVALLSDGLDSAAGAAARLAATSEPYSFVSVITKSIRDDRIASVRECLKQRFGPDRVGRYCLDVSLADPERRGESTQRFRTVLSIVAGLTIAAAEEADVLEVFENGIGILNLPAPNIQLVNESSQALSPANVPMWREVASLLLGRSVTIQYPFRWKTKAELCMALSGDLRDIIRLTRSCDGEHRVAGEGLRECGVCGSCIARKLAIMLAQIDPMLDTRYRVATTPYHHGVDVAAVCRLHEHTIRRALELPDPWQELVRAYPTLRYTVASDGHGAASATVDLLARYYDELSTWLGRSYAA